MSLQKIQKSIFQFTCVTLKFYGSVPFNIVKGKKKKQVKPNMILSKTFLWRTKGIGGLSKSVLPQNLLFPVIIKCMFVVMF